MQKHLEGGATPRMVSFSIVEYEMVAPVPPWLRMEIYCIHPLWFRRARAMMTLD